MALKVNIHAIRQNKASEIKGRFVTNARELELVSEPFEISEPVMFSWSVANAGDLYILEGKLEVCFKSQCSRCLKDVTVSQNTSFSEQLGRNASETDPEEFLAVSGDEIDLAPVLREYILLNAPVKPLCATGCKGLCPRCGQDKNVGECSCQTTTPDPRLQVLQKLLKDD